MTVMKVLNVSKITLIRFFCLSVCFLFCKKRPDRVSCFFSRLLVKDGG